MPSFKVTLAYDGTDFVGWQRQASGVSIQGLVEDALRELDGADVAVTGAGRTDAGVHALAQVAGFTLRGVHTPEVVARALNARLPQTVRVVRAESAAPDFHARFAARSKTYRYRIWNGAVVSPFERRYVWHIVDTLDVAAMHAAVEMLKGRHDFAAFQAAGSDATSTEREILMSCVFKSNTTEGIDSIGRRESRETVTSLSDDLVGDLRGGAVPGSLVVCEMTGDGFLRHMVRAIVGTLVEIGRGRRSAGWIQDVLASRDRSAAGRTAPAEGLFLTRIDY
jgi:tRNA pseudouridine38-40 synthase